MIVYANKSLLTIFANTCRRRQTENHFFFLTGLYEFQIMPLGLHIAPVISQGTMEEVLKKYGTTIKVCFAVVWQQRCS